jgi:hypothetical protein
LPGDALALGGEARPALPVVSFANGGVVVPTRDNRQPVSTPLHQIRSRLTAIPTACAVVLAPSRARAIRSWVLTVVGLTCSLVAASGPV